MGKTKLHHNKKSKMGSRLAATLAQEGAAPRDIDHDLPDPDMILFQMARSPKQENL